MMSLSCPVRPSTLGAVVLLGTACGGTPVPTLEDRCRPTIVESSAGLVEPEENPDLQLYLETQLQEVPDSGGWLLEGDMHFVDTAHLAAAVGLMNAAAGTAEPEPVEFRSTVACTDTQDLIWTVDQRFALSYCLGPFEDEELRNTVLVHLRSALRQSERVADVNYVLIPTASGEDCFQKWLNGDVRFIVREGNICSGDPTAGSDASICDCIESEKDCEHVRGSGSFPALPSNTSFSGRLVFFHELLETRRPVAPSIRSSTNSGIPLVCITSTSASIRSLSTRRTSAVRWRPINPGAR